MPGKERDALQTHVSRTDAQDCLLCIRYAVKQVKHVTEQLVDE